MAKQQQAKKSSLQPILCKGCGTRFIPKDGRQKYHSDSCRESYYARTYFARQSMTKVCPNCDTSFPTTMPGRQTYCSPECREDAHGKRVDARAASVSAERKTFLEDRFTTLKHDEFRCVFCGKGVPDGVKLDVEDDGQGGLCTICNLCAGGRIAST